MKRKGMQIQVPWRILFTFSSCPLAEAGESYFHKREMYFAPGENGRNAFCFDLMRPR